MCWRSKNAVSKIADKDIECFKLVLQDESNTIYSFYNEFEYELNKLYKTELDLINCKNNTDTAILQGFHSYSNKTRINLNNIYSKYSYILTKDKPAKLVIANCVIPKGSTYYINENEELVSNQIIITNIKEV